MKTLTALLLTVSSLILTAPSGPAQTDQQTALLKYFPVYSGVEFPVGTNPTALCYDGAHIWVANYGSNNVTELETATGKNLGTFPVGSGPYGICFDGANIWVANDLSHNLTKLSAATGQTLGTFPVGNGSFGICYDGTSIWAVCRDSNSVAKVDPKTGAVLGTYPVGKSPRGICYNIYGHLWVTNCESGTVSELDPATGSVVKTWPAGPTPTAICSYGQSIWVTNPGSNAVSWINDYQYQGPLLHTYAASVGRPWGIASGKGVWVTYDNAGKAGRASSSQAGQFGSEAYAVGNTPRAIYFDGVNMWVANYGSNTVSKL